MFTTKEKRSLRSIRDLVMSHIRFRMKVYYLEGSKHKSGTFYGEEWSCTLEQIIWKRVTEIKLDRFKGYMDLVNMVENGYLTGKYSTALIYEHDGKDYNILCRKYNNGVLESTAVNDPVFDDTNSALVLTPVFKPIPGTKDQVISVIPIDFKNEVNSALSEKEKP
jgi:hypothetical protein